MARLIDILEPIYQKIPEIKPPETEPTLKQKIMWTSAVLILFFTMGKITLLGLDITQTQGQLEALQLILASQIGTLTTAGISPIVLASIILQLLVGGKIISLDLTNTADRTKFQGLQKMFAIALSFFEGFIYPASGFLGDPALIPIFPLMLQIAFGSIIIIYLDEIVSKYGIGSGIGLFIAGGVSQGFFWQVLRPPITPLSPTAPPVPGGIIWTFIESFSTGVNLILLIPIISAIIFFLIITYAHGMHVNIPITMGRKGTGGRYPVKLLYVSNIPVILAIALFANLQIIGRIVQQAKIPLLNEIFNGSDLLLIGNDVAGYTQVGIVWAVQAPFNLIQNLLTNIQLNGLTQGILLSMPAIVQGIVYVLILIIFCIIFGKFWVELGGQGPEDIAKQLQSSGMYIPGFRRDKRIIVKILERYIPTITVMGSIFVGLLAGIGDMFLGNVASGTGILLTVGIIYRMYEEIAKQQIMQSHPILQRVFG